MEVNAKRRHGMYNKPLLIFSGGTDQALGADDPTDQRSFTAYDPESGKKYPESGKKYSCKKFRIR